jgi:hypothetical protein
MKVDYEKVTPLWADAHKYSPAPRHRRRLVIKMLSGLEFSNCLDVGCAQPFLLKEIKKRFPAVHLAGCDVSEKVIVLNRKQFPDVEHFTMDITRNYTSTRRWDLVTCSEVLEHVDDWEQAVYNLGLMTKSYLLITVPSGRLRPMDKILGHLRHFSADDIVETLKKGGFSPQIIWTWGFPFLSIYKTIINAFSPEKLYRGFAAGKYGAGKRLFSEVLYRLFFINNLFASGSQLLILAKRECALSSP